MSTRATYEIGDLTFYVHHDGYPAGAAAKFADTIGAMTVSANGRGIDAIADRRGGACFAFIRGNMNAEPTESHQAHGDTEYRYRVTTQDRKLLVSMQIRGRDFDHWGKWSAPEPIAGFINHYLPGAVVAIEAPDPHYKRELLATIENAIAIAAEHRRIEARFQGGNPNKPRHSDHALAWERGVLEQMPARVRWLEKLETELGDEIAKNGTWGRDYYGEQLEEVRRELEALRVPIGELADA